MRWPAGPALPSRQAGTTAWVTAFASNVGALSFYGWAASVTSTTGVLVAAGTSPAIAPSPAGGFEAAVQGQSGYLVTYATKTSRASGSGPAMQSGTSPVITDSKGGVEVAFQGQDGSLATLDTRGQTDDTGEQMAAGASPALAAPSGGGWEPAFVNASGNLALWGVAEAPTVSAGTNPSIATTASSVAPTRTFPLYGQVSASSEDCLATSQDPLVTPTLCTPWSSPPAVIPPGSWSGPGDFCLGYGTDQPNLTKVDAQKLTSKIGFAAPLGDQLWDPTPGTGTTCATSGVDSRWGLLLQGSKTATYSGATKAAAKAASKSTWCITSTCGLQHAVTWLTPTVLRPWYANGELSFSASFDPVWDNAGNGSVQASVWHSYLCPWVRDLSATTASKPAFQLCVETWRTDGSAIGICPTVPMSGTDVCMSGKVVARICDEDFGGFNECVYPDFVNNYTVIWTRPQAFTRLVTNTGAAYQGKNVLGNRHYAVTVTQANLLEIVRLLNLALSMDQGNGQFKTARALSGDPSDYGVSGLEVGQEGYATNGSSLGRAGFERVGPVGHLQVLSGEASPASGADRTGAGIGDTLPIDRRMPPPMARCARWGTEAGACERTMACSPVHPRRWLGCACWTSRTARAERRPPRPWPTSGPRSSTSSHPEAACCARSRAIPSSPGGSRASSST